MQNLIESKSLLAKLMATENIIIEQKNVNTAMFDVNNRILIVPTLDEKITSFEYDLFMGHEVGHALYTPLDGVRKAEDEKIPHSITNVVEDVRIERKIKHKYPGLRASFIRAYSGLCEKNFFSTRGVNVNELNFIDRLNLYSKIGVSLGIKFDDEEKVLLKEAETTETYDEVIDLSKRIMEFMKKKEEERKASQPEESPEEEKQEEGEQQEGQNNNYDNTQNDWEDSKEKNSRMSESADTGADLDEENEIINHNDNFQPKNVENDNIRSFTDEAFKQNEKKLFAENAREWVYTNIPKVKPADVIMHHKELYKRYESYVASHYGDGTSNEEFQKIRRETNKVVSYLAKEFELRKNAEQLKRASTAKTGEIDMKRIFSYQFSEDIFKKISVVPNGKSHGLVMFLDWSGSMCDHIENTVKQLFSLVMFCKKVNIPYEVYAFASADSENSKIFRQVPKKNDLVIRDMQLLNLLSSTMSASEFNYAAASLVFLSKNTRYCPSWMGLGGTPLNEAIISAMEIIPEFQKKYKLQVVNTVFLTDGEGSTIRQFWDTDRDGNNFVNYVGDRYSSKTGLVMRDSITKNEERMENIYNSNHQTSSLIKLLKARTNCNVIGFYVIAGREFNRKMYHFYPSSIVNYEKIKSDFRKNKYAVVTTAGFDEYYVVRSEALDTEEDTTFEVKENATTRGLVSAFSKYAGNRLSNRVVLNRFIGMIS